MGFDPMCREYRIHDKIIRHIHSDCLGEVNCRVLFGSSLAVNGKFYRKNLHPVDYAQTGWAGLGHGFVA